MLKTEMETVGRIVPGVLSCSIKGNTSLFTQDSDDVVSLEKKLDEARDRQRQNQKKYILPVFREIVKEFEASFDGEKATKVYMNYRDVDFLADAYNEERTALGMDENGKFCRDRVSTFEDKMVVDGIIIKKGCDREYGELNIHSFQ